MAQISIKQLEEIVRKADAEISKTEIKRGAKFADKLSWHKDQKNLLQIVKTLIDHILDTDEQLDPTPGVWKKYGFKVIRPPAKSSSKTACIDGEIVKFLGAGAFGQAYLVRKGDKTVVVKLEQLSQMRMHRLERFVKAIEVTQAAGDMKVGPAIYDTYACYHNRKHTFVIVMEYIDGPTIKDWSNVATREELKQAGEILKEKLAKLHAIGFVHGDIANPENSIIVIKNGKLKDVVPIDFGISGNPQQREMANIDFLVKHHYKAYYYHALAGHLLKHKLITFS